MVCRLKDAKNSNLQVSTLEVRETVLDDNVIEAIVDLLAEKTVDTVQLDDCGAYLNKQALRMARALGNVKTVRLSEPTFMSNYFLDFMLVSATKLENLRIQDHLDCRQIESLALGLKANSSLSTLDLSRSRLDSFSILANGLKLNSSLKTLKLRSLGLEDEHIDEMFDSLKGNQTLKSLDLSFNHYRDPNKINKFLATNKSISEICLGYQNLWQTPKVNIAELVSALSKESTIVTLSLCRNKLTDQDAVLLASAIIENSKLESLDVRENNFSDEGAIALANAAAKGQSLRKINVMKNPFEQRGLLAFLTAARENMNLVYVELGADKAGPQSTHIQYFTALNRGGRRLLHENPPLSLWPLVLERVNEIDWDKEAATPHLTGEDVMYFLLQGPAVFEGLACRNVCAI